MILDSHIHLNALKKADLIIHNAEALSFKLLVATIDHADYLQASARFSRSSIATIGCGLHPWYANKIDLNEDYAYSIKQASLISEVGLDFSKKHKASALRQISLLDEVFKICSCGDKTISLHSVKASDVMIELLKKYNLPSSCTIIFHSYNGSSKELHEAIRLGCFFSIGSRMLNTRQGREYIKIIPENRTLLETDAPQPGKTFESIDDIKKELISVSRQIKTIRSSK